MHIYEYLFTAIILISILLASSTMITNLSQPSRDASEREQLKVTAEKITTQILLDPGHPTDWGGNISVAANQLTSFGLAKYGETARQAYTLDADKVARIGTSLAGLSLPSDDVLRLLNLGHEYGFALQMDTPLALSIQQNGDRDSYTISMLSKYVGLQIVNAIVNATVFYSNGEDQVQRIDVGGTTDFNGQCIFDFGDLATEMKIMQVVVDYTSIRIQETFAVGSAVEVANLFGNHILLDQPIAIASASANELIVTKSNGVSGHNIVTVSADLTQESASTYALSYVEPSTLAVIAVSGDGTSLVLARRSMGFTYSSIASQTNFPFSYSVERTVIIDGFTFAARIYVWRMSW